MGDMRTPDFDDLLAAFDIPDVVDPKTAIESGQVDNESQLRPTNVAVTTPDEPQSTQDVGISVIVKNTRNKDNKGQLQSSTYSTAYRKRQESLSTVPLVKAQKKNEWGSPNDKGLIAPMNTSPGFNKFSPISSAEEFDEEEKTDIEDSEDKHGSSRSTHKQFDSLVPENNFATERPQDPVKIDQNNNSPADANFKITSEEGTHQKEIKDSGPKPEELSKTDQPSSPVCNSGTPQVRTNTSDNLSSCIADIAALSDQKVSAENYETSNCLQLDNEHNLGSSLEDDSPDTPKKTDKCEPSQITLPTQLPDCPSSVPSERSRKNSSVSVSDKIPVIPKVRIKTIKTKTGQIKRTVSRVPSKDIKKLETQAFMGTKSAIFSSVGHSLPSTEAAIAAGLVNEVTKQMTMKPVATAFLPVSAVKTGGSQVINLKLANNTTVKATVIPASSVQSTNGAILKTANGIQHQAVMVPTSNLVNTKLPKTMHLGNLNLLPQTMATSACDLQQTFTFSHNHQNNKSKCKLKI